MFSISSTVEYVVPYVGIHVAYCTCKYTVSDICLIAETLGFGLVWFGLNWPPNDIALLDWLARRIE